MRFVKPLRIQGARNPNADVVSIIRLKRPVAYLTLELTFKCLLGKWFNWLYYHNNQCLYFNLSEFKYWWLVQILKKMTNLNIQIICYKRNIYLVSTFNAINIPMRCTVRKCDLDELNSLSYSTHLPESVCDFVGWSWQIFFPKFLQVKLMSGTGLDEYFMRKSSVMTSYIQHKNDYNWFKRTINTLFMVIVNERNSIVGSIRINVVSRIFVFNYVFELCEVWSVKCYVPKLFLSEK